MKQTSTNTIFTCPGEQVELPNRTPKVCEVSPGFSPTWPVLNVPTSDQHPAVHEVKEVQTLHLGSDEVSQTSTFARPRLVLQPGTFMIFINVRCGCV